jgi:hypothetical protein
MANLIYDSKLSFGTADLASAAEFPNVLNLGIVAANPDHYPGATATNADRRTCDVCCKAPAGGTSLTVHVQGSADGAAGWVDVGINTFTLAQLQAGPAQTAVSPNGYPFLKVTMTPAGSFTGTAECFLNTYAGK